MGKSSFINLLAGRGGLARTSAEPGRTRLDQLLRLRPLCPRRPARLRVSRASRSAEKQKWARLLDDFFARSGPIAHVFSPSRTSATSRPPTTGRWSTSSTRPACPFTVIATKADKLAKTRVRDGVRKVAAALRTGEGNVIAVSAQTKRGRDEVLAVLDGVCARWRERPAPEDADGQAD